MARELTYLDFDVLLERGGQGSYRARVVNAPAGQTPPVPFAMPFTPLELENFLLRIGRPRRVVRRVDAPETAAIKTFGGQLYRALFHDDLEVNLLRSLSEAAARRAGLRIRLRLSDTPELAGLPWEFLYDHTRNRFLCLSDRTPLVRFLEVPDPPRPLMVSPPLQVLVMIASPSDHPQLDVEQEWSKLRTALGPLEQAGQVQVTRLEAATLAALRQQLRRANWHVLHFIGHGGFDPHTQDGVLVLEDQLGRSRLVSGQDLGVLLHDHDPLRLVVLNACEGARSDPSDPFAGTAQSLIHQGIPAVVAMQFEITDPAAISFASELYAAVADSYPLDAALAEARKAIWADGNQVEWANPVLYLRAPDGRIFNVTPTAAANPPSTAAFTPPASAGAPSTRASTTELAATASTAESATPPSVHLDTGWSSARAQQEAEAKAQEARAGSSNETEERTIATAKPELTVSTLGGTPREKKPPSSAIDRLTRLARRIPMWLLMTISIIGVLVLIFSAFTTFSARNSGRTSSGSTASSSNPTSSTEPDKGALRRSILVHLTPIDVNSCVDDRALKGALLSMKCQADGVTALHVATFNEMGTLQDAYNVALLKANAARDTGALNCSKNKPGEGAWSSGNTDVGRYLCYLDKHRRAWLHWTYDDPKIYAYIYRRDANIKALDAWWDNNFTA